MVAMVERFVGMRRDLNMKRIADTDGSVREDAGRSVTMGMIVDIEKDVVIGGVVSMKRGMGGKMGVGGVVKTSLCATGE